MLSTSTYKELQEAKKAKKRILSQLEILLTEYNIFLKFFKSEDGVNSTAKAEQRYFNHIHRLISPGAYEEGKFYLEHISLQKKMQLNKDATNILNEELKTLQAQIANLSIIFSKQKNTIDDIIREKKEELLHDIEGELQVKDVEIVSISAHSTNMPKMIRYIVIMVSTHTHRLRVSYVTDIKDENVEISMTEFEIRTLHNNGNFFPKTLKEAIDKMKSI